MTQSYKKKSKAFKIPHQFQLLQNTKQKELLRLLPRTIIQSDWNVCCWPNRKGFSPPSPSPMYQTYQSVVFRYDFCQISVTISQHRPLPPDFVASLGAFLFRAKSQVLNMLSPCNARLKSLQTFAKFFLFHQSAANSFFHAACNFVATELTSLPEQGQALGQVRGCVLLRQCATPNSQHAPVYTFAPL